MLPGITGEDFLLNGGGAQTEIQQGHPLGMLDGAVTWPPRAIPFCLDETEGSVLGLPVETGPCTPLSPLCSPSPPLPCYSPRLRQRLSPSPPSQRGAGLGSVPRMNFPMLAKGGGPRLGQSLGTAL